MIESFSVFARPRAPERQAMEVAEIVGHVLGVLRARLPHDARVRTDVQVAADTVMADAAAQITTALTQLVVNAIEACVAQTIAESHGGGVRLVTAGGPGAEFVLRLPLESCCMADLLGRILGGSAPSAAPARSGGWPSSW